MSGEPNPCAPRYPDKIGPDDQLHLLACRRHAPAGPVDHLDPDDPDLSMAWADMDSWPDEQQEDDPV